MSDSSWERVEQLPGDLTRHWVHGIAYVTLGRADKRDRLMSGVIVLRADRPGVAVTSVTVRAGDVLWSSSSDSHAHSSARESEELA